MVDYETVKKEGEKYGLQNITEEEYKKHGKFSSLVTILTRIKNARQDTAKRIRKEQKVKKETRQQPEPKIVSVAKREGPECPIEQRVKEHCKRLGFDCEKNCWQRTPGTVFAVEGLTIMVECGEPKVSTKPSEPKKGKLIDWLRQKV